MKTNLQIKIINPFKYWLYLIIFSNKDFFGLNETFLLRIFFFGSIFNIFFQKYALFLTPFMLLFIGIYCIYPFLKKSEIKFLIYILIISIITIIIEAIGTSTGLIFGNYIYGETLGFKVLNVPLIIGLNWVIVILGTTYISTKLIKNKFFAAIGAGLLSVIFDFILEPNAIKLDYWRWQDNIIPIQNYISWFFITFAFSFVYLNFFKVRDTKKAGWSMIYQTIFFAVLLIIY